jgi:ABC-2 type transport system ATP-binding protein
VKDKGVQPTPPLTKGVGGIKLKISELLMDKVIEISGLKKSFKIGHSRSAEIIRAVNGLDFEVRHAEIFGLIGPDAAGKTTTLRMIAGIMDPDEGKIRVLGTDLPAGSEKIKGRVGYMGQKFNLYSDLSVEENMRFFADIYGISKKNLDDRLGPLYSMTRLESFKKRPAGQLSGGMKQKLALMCTLINRPELLLLDEPTTGVDPVSRREFWEILQSVTIEGVAVVISTPYMDEAEWCKRVGLMYEGRFLSCSSPSEMKHEFKMSIAEFKNANASFNPVPSFKRITGLVDYHMVGRRYRLVCSQPSVLKNVLAVLRPHGKVTSVPPTIEDIFLHRMRSAAKEPNHA